MSDDTGSAPAASASAASATSAAAASDAVRDAAIKQYELDIVAQKKSGPWELTAEQAALNRKVFAAITDIIPIPDIHKHSDCDLIYRYLIAKRWKVEDAATGLREYVKFRADNKLDTIVWEDFPEEIENARIKFLAVDLNGYPIGLNRPDPTVVAELMQKYPREMLLRHQFKIVENGRRICLSLGADRITTIVDLTNLGLSIVRNMSAMGLLKEASHIVQMRYPENAITVAICNGGFTFSAIWAIIKPFLDERVQKKFKNCGSGSSMSTELATFCDLSQIPKSYGGTAGEEHQKFRAIAELPKVEKGTYPTWPIGGYKGALAFDGPGSPVAISAPTGASALPEAA